MRPVYLDYAASAPMLEAARDAMMPFLTTSFGNPSSVHAAGRAARHAVESARERVAEILGAVPAEIIFTSGGTESNQMAVSGMASGAIVTSPVEHDAILKPVEAMAAAGREVHFVPISAHGRVAPDSLPPVLPGALFSFMLVNNEVGTINPVAELAERCHESGGWLHTDAVQAPAFMPVRVDETGVDLMTLSGHKIGGPKGVGVLYVRAGVPFEATTVGGGQERDRRGGTENVAGIVGLAEALHWHETRRTELRTRLQGMGSDLRRGLLDACGELIQIHSPDVRSAPHIVSIGVPGLPAGEGAEMLILGLDMEGIQVSAGSACSSGALAGSHVMRALGRGDTASIRFSLGWDTRSADVARAVDACSRIVRRVTAVAS